MVGTSRRVYEILVPGTRGMPSSGGLERVPVISSMFYLLLFSHHFPAKLTSYRQGDSSWWGRITAHPQRLGVLEKSLAANCSGD